MLFHELKHMLKWHTYLVELICERVNQTEANGGHRGDRTLDRMRSLFDRTRPISA
jgi:hypothetical protein